MNFPRGRNWVLLFIFAALTVAILAFLLFDKVIGDQGNNLYKVAPIQIVLGSIVFLLGITAVVAVFARLGLQDKDKALAMPEGSVRALLALILLIIFVIFGNIIYGQTQNMIASSADYSGLTEAQVEQLPGAVLTRDCEPVPADQAGPQAATSEVACSGTYQQMIPNPARSDLGLQIVTALLTLVTAVASFYFGAKAAGDGSSPPKSDATPPTVVSTTPAMDAVDVAVDGQLSIAFSKPMAAATVTTSTLTLAAGGINVATAVVLASDGMTATMTPTSALTASTLYTAAIVGGTSGVTDRAGNPLASGYTWSFTTAS